MILSTVKNVGAFGLAPSVLEIKLKELSQFTSIMKEFMMNINEKVILTDYDGVLADWVYGFTQFLARHGYNQDHFDHVGHRIEQRYNDISDTQIQTYVGMFNESAGIAYLSPLRDSVKYIRKLHEEHGFVFHCITKLGDDPMAIRLREFNCERLFGKTAFEKMTCINQNANKSHYLKAYKDTGCVWVEDHMSNAIQGVDLGLNCYLMDGDHNKNDEHPMVTRVANWKEIYEDII